MNAWSQTMLLWSWQSLLLVVFILIVVRISLRQSAATRHSIWLLGIVVIAIFPAANAVIRALPAPTYVVASIEQIAELPSIAVQAVPQPSPVAVSGVMTQLLFVVWSAGFLISAAHSLRARRRWRRLVAAARCVRLTEFPVPLGYTAEVDTPVLVGVLDPIILMPADIEEWMSDEEKRAVILHELAHVERRDHWVNVIQAVLGAVFFFHPAVRYALRQLVLERELACDEHVLRSGMPPASYAEVLLKVAERGVLGRQNDCPAFNTSGRILERRIHMILNHQNPSFRRWTLSMIAKVSVVLGLATLLLPWSAVTAESVPAPPAGVPHVPVSAVMPGVSVKMGAIAREPAAEPVQPAAVQAPAQVQIGKISGTVSDQTGAVVPGVTVTLAGAAGNSRTVITNDVGQFEFSQLEPGQYSLQANLPGFSKIDRLVLVSAGATSVQNVVLPLGRIETVVNVSTSRRQNTSPGPRPKRIGGNISAPVLVSAPKPVYPAPARASAIQDVVQLQGVIGVDGSIVSLQVDKSRAGSANEELVQAAMDAVRQWRYTPALLNGVPVEFATTITVNFTLVD
jgi:TonB family protein